MRQWIHILINVHGLILSCVEFCKFGEDGKQLDSLHFMAPMAKEFKLGAKWSCEFQLLLKWAGLINVTSYLGFRAFLD